MRNVFFGGGGGAYSSRSQSIIEGCWARNSSWGRECCTLSLSATFFVQHNPTYLVKVLSIVGWVIILYQLPIKKMLHRESHRPICSEALSFRWLQICFNLRDKLNCGRFKTHCLGLDYFTFKGQKGNNEKDSFWTIVGHCWCNQAVVVS